MASQTGDDVATRFVDHGFPISVQYTLFVLRTLFERYTHFLIVSYGGMSILTARDN
jgi:hypothetical protein